MQGTKQFKVNIAGTDLVIETGLERMKDSSNINVQNDAHYLLRLVDALK